MQADGEAQTVCFVRTSCCWPSLLCVAPVAKSVSAQRVLRGRRQLLQRGERIVLLLSAQAWLLLLHVQPRGVLLAPRLLLGRQREGQRAVSVITSRPRSRLQLLLLLLLLLLLVVCSGCVTAAVARAAAGSRSRQQARAICAAQALHHAMDAADVVVAGADELEQALDRVLAQHAAAGQVGSHQRVAGVARRPRL
jgi:hypothetical protein